MCVQHSPALRGLHFTALRSLLLGQLQCSYQVQQFGAVSSSDWVTADVQPTFETCAEVGADALLQAPGPSQEQLLNVVPSQFGSTLATADLQPVAVSAARSMNMMPSADSREQHFELVDGLDSLHSYTALAAEVFLQVPAASLPPIVATAASQLFVPAAPSATLQLSVLSDGRKRLICLLLLCLLLLLRLV